MEDKKLPTDETPTELDTPDNTEQDQWLDILGNGLLLLKTIKPGLGEETRPQTGDLVTVAVVEKFQDGTFIHAKQNQVPFSFRVGEGDVIAALDLALPFMHTGEIVIIKCNSRYAYGDIGLPSEIPPSTDILLEVELVNISFKKDIDELSLSERLEAGLFKKERGNNLFNRGLYSDSINSYNRGIAYLKIPDSANLGSMESLDSDIYSSVESEIIAAIKSAKKKCMNNLAAALVKEKQFRDALKICDQVLETDANDVKALFRKGLCFIGLGDFEEAQVELKKAILLEPRNVEIREEYHQAKTLQNLTERRQKKIYGKMMGRYENLPSKTEAASSSVSYLGFLENQATLIYGLLAFTVIVVAVLLHYFF